MLCGAVTERGIEETSFAIEVKAAMLMRLKVPLNPKYFFAKMDLCTCWNTLRPIFFFFFSSNKSCHFIGFKT